MRYPEAVVRKCSVKRVFLNISEKSEENNCAGVSFSTKLRAGYCRKEIAADELFYKICEIFKNIFFKEHLRTTDSGYDVFSSNFGAFRERFIYAIISLFLLLVPRFRKPRNQGMLINLVTGQNSDYIDKVFMEAFKH